MNIAKLRKQNNLTQEQLAKKLRVSTSTISAWENGKAEPSDEDLLKLTDIFGVTNQTINSSRLHLELHFIYQVLIMVIPMIFFILTIKYVSNIIIDTYNTNLDFMEYTKEIVNFYIFNSIVYCFLYITFIIINYMFYKVDRKPPLAIAVTIEVVFFLINIKLFNIATLILFLFPALIGIGQLIFLHYKRK